MKSHVDYVGQVFGRITVLAKAPSVGYANRWACRCACGTEWVVYGAALISGRSTSCGCRLREVAKERHLSHGESRRGLHSPEYKAWRGIKQRCLRPSFRFWKDYGGRGITVCERWRYSFENFLADMGRKPSAKHSIDRIDVDGNYEPHNCRWATRIEQAQNKRNTIPHRPCLHCGSKFKPSPDTSGKYCSQRCYHLSRKAA